MTDHHTESKKKRSGFAEFWRRFRKNRLSMLGLTILVLFFVAAILADVIAPYGYEVQDLNAIGQPVSSSHIFGTDNLGRDIFSRVVHGARISLQIGFISVSIALFFGGILGAVAGFYGRWLDTLIMRLADVMMSIPGVLLAIVVVSVLGTGMRNLMIAIGISSIPSYVRIVRASVMTLRNEEYVEAARLSGGSDFRIIVRHIIPNIMAPVIVQVTLGLGLSILSAAGLSFLGLGVQAPQPEWGCMLSSGRAYIRTMPQIVIAPGLALVMLVLSLNMIGDGLRDALDPRMKN